jgi:hypothetical protein
MHNSLHTHSPVRSSEQHCTASCIVSGTRLVAQMVQRRWYHMRTKPCTPHLVRTFAEVLLQATVGEHPGTSFARLLAVRCSDCVQLVEVVLDHTETYAHGRQWTAKSDFAIGGGGYWGTWIDVTLHATAHRILCCGECRAKDD